MSLDLPKLQHLMIENESLRRDNQRWRGVLNHERKLNAQVLRLLTQSVSQLEQQVGDLRELYFQTISRNVPTGSKEKQ